MPEETATTAPEYTFPFEVPADLGAASDDELQALHTAIRDNAATFTGLSPAETTADTVAALRAYAALARAVTTESLARRGRADEAAGEAADLATALDEFALPDEPADPDAAAEPDGDPDGGDGDPDDDDDPADPDAPATPAPAPASVTAARPGARPAGRAPARRPAPRVRDVARGSKAPAAPQGRPAYGSLTASVDLGGFSTGQTLDSFLDAARILSTRIDQYPTQPARRRGSYDEARRPVQVHHSGEGRQLTMTHYARHSAAQIRRDYPTELRVREDGGEGHGEAVALFAASERRLPGGSLIDSIERRWAKLPQHRRSLTAAAGWCAPSEMIYELCELETMEGLLDAPEIQATRGGFQMPIDGGPNFATIYDALGNSGDTHLTEAEVIADTSKVCTDIPCPEFEDVRLGVDYFCLTGSLLQRRGYPEVVARWGRASVTALAHKINQGFIAAIVAASGAANIIPADPSGDDAVSGLLSAIELAIEDIRYRNRMGFNATIEVVLPHWVIPQLRAALARRTGVAAYNVSNAQLLEAFTTRGAVPRFVYDWQDAYSGLATGPGGATPLTALPLTADFLAYPAGTWVKAVQDVVALDTVYDSTKLATNEYTAVFVEDGWAALQMCNTSRLYTARVDPSGVTGCCPGDEVS